ncbi:hypothetical protein I8H84_02155 [Candidatus Saccharibacteria bacterium]|nr:hypothetical protein [Candidatus Saccharibacteria bacterium]MBH1972749.1 hypothetical protein [Candidatus Saccharibacteria bacterium]MBH1990951.1 hypothetical protein [Candidatus Saccharibacteria bacterium]OGL23314.1 MAG: hypothetical protein A2791_00465 [Candidatus Saccharibacteria bacterium RIFCSPHIGHO2_01_FULL_46_30]
MQIFTIEMFLQALAQAREMVQLFLGTLISLTWQSILEFTPAFMAAFSAHDWSEVVVRLLVIASSVVMICRLVREMPFLALKSVGDI